MDQEYINIIPLNDKMRLKKLYEYQILDTHSEDTFDKIAVLASQIFNTPSAFITFVDEDRVFFKSNISDFEGNVVDRKDSLCSISIMQEGHTVFYDAQTIPYLKNNPFVWHQNAMRFYASAPLKTPEGYLLGTLCVVDNQPRVEDSITRLQLDMLRSLSEIIINKLESRLRYKTLLKSQIDLMNITLHEIKNPLASINLANDILLKDDSKKGRMTDMIKCCVTTIQSKLSDFLKQSELEETELKLSIEETDLKEIFEKLIKNFELLANRKNQKIKLEYPDAMPKIYIDKQKISDVFHNLLSNAIKYSYFNSDIDIIVKREGDTVEIEFRDQGQGLDAEDKEKLFKKFAKLSSKPTGKENSNGLGLSICKALIDMHHGKIYAESEGKNKGTSFYISLPMVYEMERQYEF